MQLQQLPWQALGTVMILIGFSVVRVSGDPSVPAVVQTPRRK